MRCINCGIAMQRLLRHPISSLSAHHQTRLSRWITNAQTQLPLDTFICNPCFLLLNSKAGENERLLGHIMVCLGCGKSIRKIRHHNVSMDCPLLGVLLSRNTNYVPSRNNYVCHVCWMRTNRQALHESSQDMQELASDNNAAAPNAQVVSPPKPPPLPPVQSGPLRKVCRVCLAFDVKMYDLKDIELREMFQNITGIVVTENNHSMLERLCWECAGRLKAAAVFRNKALLSDALLQGLVNTGEQIRKNDIILIKENQDYLKSAGTLSIVEVFHTVEIDAEYESAPSISENNDTDAVQNTVRTDSIEPKESMIKENNDQMDVEDEPMIDFPIKTEIEYDPICSNTDEEQINIVLERNPLISNNIPLREDTINSAYSSPPCSYVEPKYPIIGYLKTPIENSDCENKIKKTVVKITNRDSISKIVSKKSKELIIHDHRLKGDAKLKINLKGGGISKKTSKQ